MNRMNCLALALLASGSAAAGPAPEDVLRHELRETVARVLASEAFAGRASDAIGLTLTLPAERYLDLGLLLDVRDPAPDGIAVLGTTPGGTAQGLGLRAGDRIVAVGDAPLAGLGLDAEGRSVAVARLRTVLDALPDGGRLALAVERAGRRIAIDGAVAVRYLPPLRLELGEGDLVAGTGAAAAAASRLPAAAAAATASGCGRISTFHVAPRGERLYPARVLSIDGAIPGPADQDTFRLPPGTHRVEIAEDIAVQDLPAAFSRRRAALGRKTLEVVVEPGTTHLVAARLVDTLGGADYWEPVVWKTLAEECR